MTCQNGGSSSFPDELIDRILLDYQHPEDLMGEGGILGRLTSQILERAIELEMVGRVKGWIDALPGDGGPPVRGAARCAPSENKVRDLGGAGRRDRRREPPELASRERRKVRMAPSVRTVAGTKRRSSGAVLRSRLPFPGSSHEQRRAR